MVSPFKLAAPLAVIVLLAASLQPAGAASGSLSANDRASAIAELARAGDLDPSGPAPEDAALDEALRRYATRELGQRVRPGSIDQSWAIAPARRDVDLELAKAKGDGSLAVWIGQLAPTFPESVALRRAESVYRAVVATGGWRSLPPGEPPNIGQRNALAAALRTRLGAEGYAAAAVADPEVFDPPLQAQLRFFQRRHRLTEDGVLGPATRAALDVPAEARLAQIEANLERWRWLPRQLPGERLEVDIGAAEIRVLQADCETLTMKIVVGDPRRPTPMFASRIEAVTFNPPWNVPASIARDEILPKAARDPDYLAENDFIFVDGRLRQKAGPKSALGQVKFELPSPFGVYLHDTPAKGAFARPQRALSHGCMRLEKPLELAGLLLAPQGWTPERVAAAIAARKTQTVRLSTPMPLYVLYWTAKVAIDGQVEFRPDVYGWDRKLAEALAAADRASGRD